MQNSTPYVTYVQKLQQAYQRGDASEHTHRPALKDFIETLYPDLLATNEPKRDKAGAPDYVISQGSTPLGYIEAKDIGVPLDKIEKSEQLKRYFDAFNNVILTDYLEFRWYEAGTLRRSARVARVNNKRLELDPDSTGAFTMLFQGFIGSELPTFNSPAALARKMASIAQQIRFSIQQLFAAENPHDDAPNPLHEQYDSFKTVLMSDLKPAQFADMYAQTIAYGMFAARIALESQPPENGQKKTLTRATASYLIPKTNPFLRTMFHAMAGPELDTSLDWIVDDLVNLLVHADIGAILQDFGKRTRQEDPVVHFYETFLAEYDRTMREARGVYYTPEPVVSYIVRSVDAILKRDFGLPDGLADTSRVSIPNSEQATPEDPKTKDVHRVQILDPATGTGTFLHGVIDQIHQTVTAGGNAGQWSRYVSEHLLPRIYGFELLMAPYTVAHMKLGLQLSELGYDFSSSERLKIYLTNTLEEAREFPSVPMFGQAIATESKEAGQAKEDVPVMVVLGNPPYSYESKNTGEWISKKVRDYYQVDGEPLGERNPKGLQDDYVKFIRFSQWRIEQTGYGILAFITNNGYLDNPTFRGMRQSLIGTFDNLYFLNLHGDTKETAPSNAKDENVFDIQKGVSIGLFVKKSSSETEHKIYYADLYGEREGKYQHLWQTDVFSTDWTEIEPKTPRYFFMQQNTSSLEEYEVGWQMTDVFPVNSVGLYTARDHFVIQDSEDDVKNLLEEFVSLDVEAARQRFDLGIDSRDWKVELAQRDIKATGVKKDNISPVSYRPFDMRYTYYTGVSRGIICMPRAEVMDHIVSKHNLALCFLRRSRTQHTANFFVADKIVDKTILSSADNANVAPLYLYPDNESLFAQPSDAPGGRRPNLSEAFVEDLKNKLGLDFVPDGRGDLTTTFGPEDVFYYLYAVLHSPTYRERYAEFLKIDFPRIPLTSERDLFADLCAKGKTLVELHLMKARGSRPANFPEDGDNVVDKPKFDKERVYINKTQYFENVPEHVWNFYVGGYQVLHKWLKDRKGRELSYDDTQHYRYIVAALADTIDLMNDIDASIDVKGGFPLS
jgi:hypothetical protein